MKKEHMKHEAAMHKKPKHKKEMPKHKEHEKHEKHKMPKHEKHEKHDKHEKHEKHEKMIKKAMHHPDKLGAGAKKREHVPAKNKVEVVMKEFARGTLNSGSGHKVTNPKQALAIGYSEQKKHPNGKKRK